MRSFHCIVSIIDEFFPSKLISMQSVFSLNKSSAGKIVAKPLTILERIGCFVMSTSIASNIIIFKFTWRCWKYWSEPGIKLPALPFWNKIKCQIKIHNSSDNYRSHLPGTTSGFTRKLTQLREGVTKCHKMEFSIYFP